MNTAHFDGIVRDMGEVSTRRNFFRLLGGAAALGAGLAVSRDSLAKSKGHGKAKAQSKGGEAGKVSAEARNKKITICNQGQTLTVKKSKLGNFPGATRGACPDNGGGGGQPVVCTTWIISGGPNQTDRIVADDDFYIFRPSKGGASIIADSDKRASSIAPAVFSADAGEILNIVGYDSGGCRSLSPLWLHCVASGQKRQLFAGYGGANCNYGAGTFINESVAVAL